jgi:hypothetical protein
MLSQIVQINQEARRQTIPLFSEASNLIITFNDGYEKVLTQLQWFRCCEFWHTHNNGVLSPVSLVNSVCEHGDVFQTTEPCELVRRTGIQRQKLSCLSGSEVQSRTSAQRRPYFLYRQMKVVRKWPYEEEPVIYASGTNPCLQIIPPRVTVLNQTEVSNLTDDNPKRVSLIQRHVSISHWHAIPDHIAEFVVSPHCKYCVPGPRIIANHSEINAH